MFIHFLAAVAMFAMPMAIPEVSAADPQAHEGTVVTAGSGKLTMTDASGKQHMHQITDTVRITVHGKPGKLEDLKAGMRIRVTTEKDGKVLGVSTVDDQK
jgi:hypothetical protein